MNIQILDELLSELEGIADSDIAISVERTNEAAQDDERVGVLSETHLKLEALCFKLTGKAAERALEAHFRVGDKDGYQAFLAETKRFRHLAEMARVILWGLIQDEYGWTEQRLSLRRDGKALIVIKQEPEMIPAMLLKLLKNAKPIDFDE